MSEATIRAEDLRDHHVVRFSVSGAEPVLVKVPDRVEPAELLNRCRARVFPDVAMVPASLEAVPAPKKRRRA